MQENIHDYPILFYLNLRHYILSKLQNVQNMSSGGGYIWHIFQCRKRQNAFGQQ